MGRCPPPVARLVVLASLTEETFKGPVHRQPRTSGQAAAGAGPARHRIPDGDLAAILERALDLLIEDVKKERFALGPEGPAGAEGGCRQLAPHPRCDQAGGLRTRRRALHVRGRARSALRRDWSAGVRSRGRIRPHAPARCRWDPAPLPRTQPARGGAGLRTGLHGTSAGATPSMLSSRRTTWDAAADRCARRGAKNVSGAFF